MPKWILYLLAAIGDVIFAILAYQYDRTVIAVILILACFGFTAAAIGSFKESRKAQT